MILNSHTLLSMLNEAGLSADDDFSDSRDMRLKIGMAHHPGITTWLSVQVHYESSGRLIISGGKIQGCPWKFTPPLKVSAHAAGRRLR
jgi:hypothetical protein